VWIIRVVVQFAAAVVPLRVSPTVGNDGAAHLGGRPAQVGRAGGVEFGGRIGAQHAVEELARQVGLEGLVCLFEGIHVENEIVHGGTKEAAY